MKKLRVLHVSNCLPSYHSIAGGAEQTAYSMIKLLRRNNYDTYVVSTKPVKEVREDFKFYSIDILEDYLKSNYIRWLKLGFFPFDAVSFFQSYKILMEIKPDIVHLHNFNFISFSIIQATKLLKIPIVLSIYDYWYFCPLAMLYDYKGNTCRKFHGTYCTECLKTKFRRFETLQKAMLVFRKVVFNYFINKIDRFIVLSNSCAEILEDYGIEKGKIRIIPATLKFKKVEKAKIEKNSVFYIGWVVSHKGLHVVINAIKHVSKKIPNVKLYILGMISDKDYKNQIINLIKKLKLEKNIVFFDRRLKKEEFESLFNRANVIVVAEQWENMSPIIVIESMASEKPIVASRIGGIPEFIENGKTGFLADPKNHKEFAEKIIKLLENRKLANKIGRDARKRAIEMFDENRNLKKLSNLYKELVSG